MNVKNLATKIAVALGFLSGVYILELIWTSEIPDWILWGGAIFFVVFIVLTERDWNSYKHALSRHSTSKNTQADR